MELKVTGMSCGHCVGAVTRALRAVDPNARVEVDLTLGRVVVAGALSSEQARSAIEAAGYGVTDAGSCANAGLAGDTGGPRG